MKFNLLHLSILLSAVAVIVTHAVTPEVYWKSVLPNTPMPKSIKDLLYTEWSDEKNTAVGVGKGGVGVHTGKPGKRTDVGVTKGGVAVHTGKPGGKRTDVGVGKGGVGVHTGKPGKRTDVGVGKGGVDVHTGHKGKPVYVGVHKGPNPFIYNYAASENQLNDDPNVALFFLEHDLHPLTEMNLQFPKTDQNPTFLPRKTADSIPFSSQKLPEIYNEFAVKPESPEAETMKQTITECENTPVEGEDKYCATSLESMVDFTRTRLGQNLKAISTEVMNSKQSYPLQKYTIKTVKHVPGKKAVVCHRQNYAYAVFYCHKTASTKAYEVSMVGMDGTKVKAVAVCHTDTGKWNPKHLAFQVLKVKPGTVPICHFLPQDHVVWVPKSIGN